MTASTFILSVFARTAPYLLCALWFALPPHVMGEVMQFDHARALNLEQDVALPHVWTHDPKGMMGVVHYRVQFAKPEQAYELQAIYLSRVNMAVRVTLNGQEIGESGFYSDPLGRFFHTPILYAFPAASYVDGLNTLDVEVKAYANRFGSLSVIQLGTYTDLLPLFGQAYFEDHTLQIISTALSAIFVLFLLPVWWVRRESVVGWFIGGSLAWSVGSLNVFWHEIPIASGLWEWLIHMSVGMIPLCYSLFIFRLIGQSYPRVERFYLGLAALFIPLALLFVGSPEFFIVASLWHACVLLLGIFAIYRLFRFLLGKRDFSVFYIATALLIVCGLAIHDLVIQQFSEKPNSFWLNYAAPLLLTAMGLLMVRQFLSAVDTAETLNASLESRAAAAQVALEQSYAELRVLEMEHAVQSERERIYRNLHDDVGAKLLGLVISAQRANQTREAELARSALQDLREVVSRTANTSVSLINLVSDWRAEADQRISAAQLTLHWQAKVQAGEATNINPDAALNLSRILREAINNILRHAAARNISVNINNEAGWLTLEVADDGIGIPANFKSSRGMDSMQARARALNGTLHWRNLEPHGCALHLRIPIARATVGESAESSI